MGKLSTGFNHKHTFRTERHERMDGTGVRSNIKDSFGLDLIEDLANNLLTMTKSISAKIHVHLAGIGHSSLSCSSEQSFPNLVCFLGELTCAGSLVHSKAGDTA